MRKQAALIQYCGPLTTSQAEQGIQAALRNAHSLLADADLLLANQRWQRAAALAVLAIEESGKVEILRGLLLEGTEKGRREAWRAYRSHTKKNVAYILPELVLKGARKLEDFGLMFDEKSSHAQVLEVVKQLALYSDACGDCNWAKPGDVVDSQIANSLVGIAKIVVEGPTAFTTKPELDIWVKHLKPVWKVGMDRMKEALIACYMEAEALGVLQGKQTSADIHKFLSGESPPVNM